jgi:hypothetical protein
MPAGRNHSRINQGRPELIDHILVSDGLVKKVDLTSMAHGSPSRSRRSRRSPRLA